MCVCVLCCLLVLIVAMFVIEITYVQDSQCSVLLAIDRIYLLHFVQSHNHAAAPAVSQSILLPAWQCIAQIKVRETVEA